jgi:hypothetical protein
VLLTADARGDIATRGRAWLAEHAHQLPPEGIQAAERAEERLHRGVGGTPQAGPSKWLRRNGP